MRSEVSLQLLLDFSSCFVEQTIYLEVVGVAIHSTEEVFIVDCKNVDSDDLPGAAWNFTWNKGIWSLVVLKCVADLTFQDEVCQIFVHAWPIDCFSCSPEATLYSCVRNVQFLLDLLAQ